MYNNTTNSWYELSPLEHEKCHLWTSYKTCTSAKVSNVILQTFIMFPLTADQSIWAFDGHLEINRATQELHICYKKILKERLKFKLLQCREVYAYNHLCSWFCKNQELIRRKGKKIRISCMIMACTACVLWLTTWFFLCQGRRALCMDLNAHNAAHPGEKRSSKASWCPCSVADESKPAGTLGQGQLTVLCRSFESSLSPRAFVLPLTLSLSLSLPGSSRHTQRVPGPLSPKKSPKGEVRGCCTRFCIYWLLPPLAVLMSLKELHAFFFRNL